MSTRLPQVAGEWLERDQPLEFSFEGRRYGGYQGDTITSALLANGVDLLGRSFKYHRPRSVLSAAGHDANLVMQSGGRSHQPNLRADTTLLQAGMQLTPVNVQGSLASDRGSLLDRLSALLPVGFYYKAFHSKRLFPFWEALIRRYGGLGQIDITAPRRFTAKRYDFCDVLVVGAGAAGLSAALAAADAGARVVLVDENLRIGGSSVFDRGGEAPDPAVQALIRNVERHPGIRIRTLTLACGYYTDHWIALIEGARMTKLRARAVVITTGAIEQPAVFRNNDLPGIMLGSAAQRLIYRHAIRPFDRVVVLAGNDAAYRTALDLLGHGISIVGIVDLRQSIPSSPALQALSAAQVPLHAGHCIQEALGGLRVEGAVIAPFRDGEADVSKRFLLPCNGIVMSTGWAPAGGLLYQAGATMRYDDTLGQFIPDLLPEGTYAAGRVNGVYGGNRMADGRRAGLAAAAHAGIGQPSDSTASLREGTAQSHPWPIVAHGRGKNFVDFDEDLQLKDFANAVQEGFDNIELLKRYTTCGMGPSQGKHSNMNAIRILARLRGESPGQVGTTTARPFIEPVPLAHLGGRGFNAERETPVHALHAAAGAIFMPAGNWQRPEYYAVDGMSREAAIRAEALAVRSGVGLIDVGTLGKIEIIGPDAGAFLERVYTGRFANMRPGTTRYGVMLDEAAVVIDDGVVARLSEQCFYFTTTTSGSAGVYRELGRLNTLWQMNCGIVNLTGHCAAFNLAGPKSREVLQTLTGSELGQQAFPYLAAREIDIAGMPARVLRIGFVGELGFEIHVPAEHACTLWQALLQAGAAAGIRPFGVEAQRLLRLEKGHLIIGQDTDGLTNPDEAGVAWTVKMDKPFFVGQRSLTIIRKQAPVQQLAGFSLDGEQAKKVRECHLVIAEGQMAGRVTSVAYSPTLKCYVGLAMLRTDLTAIGTSFTIRVTDGKLVAARVVATPFYDAEGLRQKTVAAEGLAA